ncbi:hypothetical protein GGS23DRAFT_549222 [Durotheca rogersii]|uniref:uncharacterized protein n=1 Tax=Durotheca rogersii TaxID=419775 RepID=UPI00221F4D23|nr:uncharacterized protein GGS23DRAFT_549222 [Durotheca rogersii]KAI5867624.1 hypothetical protein GGS23DRAFT_549222 [Durotheca rogersii]
MTDNAETIESRDPDCKQETYGLSTLVPPTSADASTTKEMDPKKTDSYFSHQPHALSVDFQCHKGDGTVPAVSPLSTGSVLSLSPSLFPLPPTTGTLTPPSSPTTSQHTRPRSRSASRATSSHSSAGSAWFCPPSPPPSTPLPPLPKLSPAKLATTRLRTMDLATADTETSPVIILRQSANSISSPHGSFLQVDNRESFRESAVDPDILPMPPRSSLPPPYSPGLLTPERRDSIDGASTRVDSTVPLMAYQAVAGHASFQSQSSATAYTLVKRPDNDVEALPDPKRKRRRKIAIIAGVVSTVAVAVIVGVSVGVYFSMSTNSRASE